MGKRIWSVFRGLVAFSFIYLIYPGMGGGETLTAFVLFVVATTSFDEIWGDK